MVVPRLIEGAYGRPGAARSHLSTVISRRQRRRPLGGPEALPGPGASTDPPLDG